MKVLQTIAEKNSNIFHRSEEKTSSVDSNDINFVSGNESDNRVDAGQNIILKDISAKLSTDTIDGRLGCGPSSTSGYDTVDAAERNTMPVEQFLLLEDVENLANVIVGQQWQVKIS